MKIRTVFPSNLLLFGYRQTGVSAFITWWQILQILHIDTDKEVIVISRQTLELTMNEG